MDQDTAWLFTDARSTIAAKYDAQFEQVVQALVYLDADEKVIRPITGVKE